MKPVPSDMVTLLISQEEEPKAEETTEDPEEPETTEDPEEPETPEEPEA